MAACQSVRELPLHKVTEYDVLWGRKKPEGLSSLVHLLSGAGIAPLPTSAY